MVGCQRQGTGDAGFEERLVVVVMEWCAAVGVAIVVVFGEGVDKVGIGLVVNVRSAVVLVVEHRCLHLGMEDEQIVGEVVVVVEKWV